MDQEHIISVENLHKSFGSVHALEGVSFTVTKGTVVGLLGPNGAGKTTLVKILTTLLKQDAGTAVIEGFDVAKNPVLVRSKIGLAGQFAAIDENLTGRENIELIGRLYHLPRAVVKERTQELLEKFSLVEASRRLARTYSGGMRRRLDLASSLIGKPHILFLDEPTTGLDPKSRLELWEMIKQLVTEGTTVLLTTQYLEEADYLADSIIIIDKGKIIAEGSAKELKSKIGGGVLEIHLADKRNIPEAISVLEEFRPYIDELSDHIYIPVLGNEGTKMLLEVVRKIDSANLEISDIELRKPTLDEVFLTVTK